MTPHFFSDGDGKGFPFNLVWNSISKFEISSDHPTLGDRDGLIEYSLLGGYLKIVLFATQRVLKIHAGGRADGKIPGFF